jgi:hypothetical protein
VSLAITSARLSGRCRWYQRFYWTGRVHAYRELYIVVIPVVIVIVIVVHVHMDHDPTFEAAVIDFVEWRQQRVVFNGANEVTTDENGGSCVFTLVDNDEVVSVGCFLNGSDVVYVIFSSKESFRLVLAVADAFPNLGDIVIVVIKVIDLTRWRASDLFASRRVARMSSSTSPRYAAFVRVLAMR